MNNRQAGRRRGRGGQRQPGSGGGNPRDNGNRIDNRARGNAAQLLEKYKNLAADAQRAGDRVNTEYYLQFADHYFRVLEAGRSRVEEQQRRVRDDFDGADDEEYEFDGEGGDAQPQERGNRDDRGPREERQPRAQRDERAPREERAAREDRPQRDRPRRDTPRNAPSVGEVRAVEGEIGTQEQVTPEPVAAEPVEAKPTRRRTPRARVEAAPAAAPEAAPSIEADRLPPALSAGDVAEAPRRRRRVARTEEEVVPPAA